MIIVLTGAPGAGKGTQADLLADRKGYHKISTGDALRRQIREQTPIGLRAKSYMNEGKLVPDDILLGILQTELSDHSGRPVILDGFPRNRAQAEYLSRLLGPAVKVCLHLEVDTSLLVERISGRRTCSSCGATFHLTYSPSRVADVCDRCGGATVQRPDDTEEKVRVRLSVYDAETRPVLDFYKSSDLYQRVDGSGDTEQVYAAITEALGKWM